MWRALAGCAVILAGASVGACSQEQQPQTTAQAPQTYEQNPDLLPAALRNGALSSATPAQIRGAIAEHGAQAVVTALWVHESAEGWLRVVDQIATGQQDWLDLVPLLKPGTDGAPSETLHIAVSHALVHNPRGVLSLIAAGHEGTSVCSMIDWEPTEAEVAQFYAVAIPAVDAVSDAELQGVKRECLATLRRPRPTSRD